MVHTCAVHGCHNRADDDVKRGFFGIPTVRKHEGQQAGELSSRRRDAWISRINRKDFNPSKHTKICSDHFISGKPANLFDVSNPDWAPSIYLSDQERQSGVSNIKPYHRYCRLQTRKKRKELKDINAASGISEAVPLPQQAASTSSRNEHSYCSIMETQEQEEDSSGTNPSDEGQCSCDICKKVTTECQRLMSESFEMRQNMEKMKISEETFENDNKRVHFYTGLPNYALLLVLFSYLQPYIPENRATSARPALTKFQKLIMVLMKLRHNFPIQDLAYRFDVSPSTVSRTFVAVIHVMFIRLKRCIYWPGREELRLSMPMEFRNYFGLKVCVIIDCFEIFIERPSNLLARSKTWSSYKHHNTVKFLLGITPQGSVSFLYKSWGSRTSDKHITEHSGLLEKLLPGDIVLADRGFDIHESVGLKCAQVKIPNFTKGRTQLPALEIERTRNIAHVRIHVERVIGLVRNKYRILSGTLPIDYLMTSSEDIPTIDKIATVCCCLVNMCNSVVPFN